MSVSARLRTKDFTVAALFAALIAVSAWVSFPLGEVPVTLQTLLVTLAALMLEPVPALAAVGTYILLGAVGLPVFAGGKAGVAVLFGPTGGFLIGFLVGAWLCSLVRLTAARHLSRLTADILGAAVFMIVVYILGVAQLAAVTGMAAGKVLAVAVVPFILGDVLKAAGAVALAGTLRRALRR